MADYLELMENPYNPKGWFGDPSGHRAAALKGWRGRSRNPVGYDEFGNPITVGGYSYRKPSLGGRRVSVSSYRRRLPGERNPGALAMPATFREWTQGVDLMDAGAAVGGLAASTMIPGTIVKVTETGWQKFLKIVVSLGCALGAGALGRAMVSPSAGKAAVIGGVAGTTAQAIGAFTGFTIGEKRLTSRHIGVTTPISPSTGGREGEVTSVIEP